MYVYVYPSLFISWTWASELVPQGVLVTWRLPWRLYWEHPLSDSPLSTKSRTQPSCPKQSFHFIIYFSRSLSCYGFLTGFFPTRKLALMRLPLLWPLLPCSRPPTLASPYLPRHLLLFLSFTSNRVYFTKSFCPFNFFNLIFSLYDPQAPCHFLLHYSDLARYSSFIYWCFPSFWVEIPSMQKAIPLLISACLAFFKKTTTHEQSINILWKLTPQTPSPLPSCHLSAQNSERSCCLKALPRPDSSHALTLSILWSLSREMRIQFSTFLSFLMMPLPLGL